MQRRIGLAPRLLLLLVACSTWACRTDEARRGPDAGAAAGDAGSGDVPTDAEVRDGHGDPSPRDIPVVETTVDAGEAADPTGGPTTAPRADPANGTPSQVTVFNRVLVKPNERTTNAGAVEELAEKITGQPVERCRKTGVSFWLLQFAPTSPPRDRAAQQKLIALLQASGEFAVVEGDQVMTVK
jgi:hypothetical protein